MSLLIEKEENVEQVVFHSVMMKGACICLNYSDKRSFPHRLQMTYESCSNAHFSSSQASDTKAGDQNCLSVGDDVDAGTKYEEAIIEGKIVLTYDLYLSNASESSKESSWKTIRKMIHWIPFIHIYRKKKHPWVQLAGHSRNFLKGNKQVQRKYP